MALPVTLLTLGGVPVQLVDQTGSVFPTTGTGSLVFNTTPTLVTPILGIATGTSLALGGASGATLAVTGTANISGLITGTSFLGDGFYTATASITTRALGRIGFSANTSPSSGEDTAFSRITAGIIGVGTGAQGNIAGGLQAATLALGGATIGTNALAVTGVASIFGDANNWIQIRNNGGNYQIITNWSSGGGIPLNLGAGANHWSIATTGTLSSSSGTGAIQSTSLALGGASLGTNALAVTGTSALGGYLTLAQQNPRLIWGSGGTTFYIDYNDSTTNTTTFLTSRNGAGSDYLFRNTTYEMMRIKNLGAGSRDQIWLTPGIAIPAGGQAGFGFAATSTANFGVFFGSGAPTLSAAKGSLYLRSDGTGVADRMYVNTDASTTWTAVATVA